MLAVDEPTTASQRVVLLNEHPAYKADLDAVICFFCGAAHRMISEYNRDFLSHNPTEEQAAIWLAGTKYGRAPSDADDPEELATSGTAAAYQPRPATWFAAVAMVLIDTMGAPRIITLIPMVLLVVHELRRIIPAMPLTVRALRDDIQVRRAERRAALKSAEAAECEE